MVMYLILSIITSVLFAICYKIAVQKGCNLKSVNAWNYAGAVISILVYILITQNLKFNQSVIMLGIAAGFTSFFASLTFFMHIKYGQLSTSWTIISLSVAFPVLASIFIWHEIPDAGQILAMVFIVIAFILMGQSGPSSSKADKLSFILLMIAFFLSGIRAILLKVLVESNLEPYIILFTLSLTGTALLLGSPVLISNRKIERAPDKIIGLLMGLFNTLTVLLALTALEYIPGIIAFPVSSLGNLILTALISIIIWKDRLSTKERFGMVLSLVAIWLIV
ncbi:MAG: EamA family transporter [Armatimonadota bacterium]